MNKTVKTAFGLADFKFLINFRNVANRENKRSGWPTSFTHNGSYSWLKFALSIGLGVAQTLENGDIVKLGSSGRGADKVTAEQQGIQRRQEFPGSKRLYDVTLSAGEERIAHDFLLSVLREKQYVDGWRQFHDPAGHLNPIHVRETNIENDNIRLEFGRFLDGSQSIPRLTHDFDFRVLCNSS